MVNTSNSCVQHSPISKKIEKMRQKRISSAFLRYRNKYVSPIPMSSSGSLPMKNCVRLVEDDLHKRYKVLPRKQINKARQQWIPRKKELLREWEYLIKPENFYSCCVSTSINVNVIIEIKESLSSTQISMFRQTCFGHFLELGTLIVQPQVLHALLLREVNQYNSQQMCFNICGSFMKFGIEEFALITGLHCEGDIEKFHLSNEAFRLKMKYFAGVNKVSKFSIRECFKSKLWDCDDDAVKIAFLYFLHFFLLSNVPNQSIPDRHFQIVDSSLCNMYPWGKESFDYTLNSMKEKYTGKSHRGGYVHPGFPSKCSLLGCPIVLQIWFYECCGAMNGKFATHIASKIPRILNWCSNGKPHMKDLQRHILSLPSNLLKLKNITATSLEKEKLHLVGLSDKGKATYFDDFQSIEMAPNDNDYSDEDSGDEVSQSKEQQTNEEFMLLKECVFNTATELEGLKVQISSLKDYIDQYMVQAINMLQCLMKSDVVIEKNKAVKVLDLGIATPNLHAQVDDVEIVHREKNREPRDEGRTYVFHESGSGSKDGANANLQVVKVPNVEVTTPNLDAQDADVDIVHLEKNSESMVEGHTIDFHGSVSASKDVANANFQESYCEGSPIHFLDNMDPNELDELEGSAHKLFASKNTPAIASSSCRLNIILDDAPSFDLSLSPCNRNHESLPLFDKTPQGGAVFGSTSKSDKSLLKNKAVKGLCPFHSIDAFDFDDTRIVDFDQWLREGVNKLRRGKIYVRSHDTIGVFLDFSVELVREKIWLYDLRIPGRCIKDSHVNVLFYYLRKKVKYGNDWQVRCTTTNNIFDGQLQSLYDKYTSSGCDLSVLKYDQDIVPNILGYFMDCCTPWINVDHVLFPIYLGKRRNQWILARLTFSERRIYLYNCFRSPLVSREARLTVSAYCVLLPFLVQLSGFYTCRTDIDLHSEPYIGKSYSDPYVVVQIQNLPSQLDNDSGIFMTTFAEYFIENRQIPSQFDVDYLRKRFAFLLYQHGLRKSEEDIDSDIEICPPE